MSATRPAGEPFWVRWTDGERGVALVERWHGRLRRFAAPEVVIATVIVVVWSLLATVPSGSTLLLIGVLGIGLWVHFAAVETGTHSLTWIASGSVLLLVVVAATTSFDGFGPVTYTLAALTAIAHNELVRLSLARRRSALIDESIYVSSAIALAVVGLVSGVGIGVAQRVSPGSDRSWLWMAAAAVLLTVAAVLLTTVPAHKAPPGIRDRWRPGDRIPPQPLGDAELE